MSELNPERQSVVAVVVFALLALVPIGPVSFLAGAVLLMVLPGLAIVRAMRIGRRWGSTGRFALGVAVSVAVVPVILNPLWHLTNDGRMLLIAWTVILLVGTALLKVPRPEAEDGSLRFFEHGATKWYAVLIGLVVLVATVGPYWPTELLGFPVPSGIHDFIKHHAVLDSFGRRPLPLGNIFYADGAEGPVYYYHFFYIIPATLIAWSGVSIEFAFGIASCVGALSLTSVVYMTVKQFKGGEGPATLAATFMTLVGALDVIPLAVDMATGRMGLVVTLDAWADNVYRVHNFLNQMMWSPQNVQGVTVAMVGVLLLGHYGRWRGWITLGPVLGASLVGSSVWVAMAVLPGLAVWGVVELVASLGDRRTLVRTLAGLVVVAALMAVCASPSLLGYMEMSARHGKSLTSEWTPHHWAVFGRLLGPGVLANVLDLPMMMLFDQGAKFVLLFLVGAATWRRAWQDAGLRLLWLSGVIGVAGMVTVRSHFCYNDFGQKIMLVPMAFGAVMAACVLDGQVGRRRWWNPLGWQLDREAIVKRRGLYGWCLGLMIVAGLPMGFYEVPLTAVRRHIEGRRTAADVRAARQFMRHELPGDAVVQVYWGGTRDSLVQVIRRQMGVMAETEDVMVFRPQNAGAYGRALGDVERALGESASAQECYDLLRMHGVTHLYLGSVEREEWQHLEKLGDERLFRLVFESGDERVYELAVDAVLVTGVED